MTWIFISPTLMLTCLRCQDGSFYVWTAKAFDLVRSFQLPYAPQLRMLQRTFALSPDGELLVSAGLKMPVLLVYHLVRSWLGALAGSG